jgi:hypothetical protein
MSKKVGRPPNNQFNLEEVLKRKPILREGWEFELIQLLFDDSIGMIQKLMSYGFDEEKKKQIAVMIECRRQIEELEGEIFNILLNEDFVKHNLEEMQKLKVVLWTERILIFKVLKNAKLFKTKLYNVSELKNHECENSLFYLCQTYMGHKGYSRKGGPEPFYLEYIILPCLKDLFKKANKPCTSSELCNFIYNKKILELVREYDVVKPSDETFANTNTTAQWNIKEKGEASQMFLIVHTVVLFLSLISVEKIIIVFNFINRVHSNLLLENHLIEIFDLVTQSESLISFTNNEKGIEFLDGLLDEGEVLNIKFYSVKNVTELKKNALKFWGSPTLKREYEIMRHISNNIKKEFIKFELMSSKDE